jgi:hypothetical protein
MSDYDGPNELIDSPPLLTEQEAGPEMVCPACIELGDARDWETGEYLADDCGVCGGTGWLPEEGAR